MTDTRPEPPHPDLPDAGREAVDAAVADLLALLGKRHTLSILYLFARDPGPWRFGELESRLDLSPTTLSDRLAELTARGFLDRTDHEEVPPRVEYGATERAEALKPTFGHLYGWCREYGQGVRH